MVLALTVFLTGADNGDEAFLPGITVADEYPNGCVDCHQADGDHHDRLDEAVANLEGHPKVAPMMRVVPKDCMMCHKQGGSASPLSQSAHQQHYENPSENHFVTEYQGACLHCHTMDTETGSMAAKNGDKNW